jgi:hypothetical protein
MRKIGNTALATLALVLAASPAAARQLDPANPADAFEISKRAQCGEADGKPAVYYWSGRVYSRVTGEPDRHLFNGEGMNIRQCVAVSDPKRGKGYRLVSREVMFYLDPKTNEVLRTWQNPWTDETVEVMHINNDPVNSRPSFPLDANGNPVPAPRLLRQGKWLLMPLEAPLFYDNPLAGSYQDYIGGKYQAMEIFDFAFDAREMLDTKNPTAYPTVSWVRISDWMPWMKMRGRQGQMVFNAMGAKLKSYDELPATIKTEIATNWPIYTAPPPGDDPRPNATTWTVFKKLVDERQGTAPKPAGH